MQIVFYSHANLDDTGMSTRVAEHVRDCLLDDAVGSDFDRRG